MNGFPPRFKRMIAGCLLWPTSVCLAGTAGQISPPRQTVPDEQAKQAQDAPKSPPVAPQDGEVQGGTSGTAAAPVIRSEGNPASAPAGAAIAPAKQRRAHSYALRVGLIVGAAVAVGVVAAAAHASSSRPN